MEMQDSCNYKRGSKSGQSYNLAGVGRGDDTRPDHNVIIPGRSQIIETEKRALSRLNKVT